MFALSYQNNEAVVAYSVNMVDNKLNWIKHGWVKF